MAIKSLNLANVGPFRPRPDGSGSDGIKLEFDANVNLFIGPNNVGKSTILQALAAVTARPRLARNAISALPGTFTSAVTDRKSVVDRPEAEFQLIWSGPIGDHREFWNALDYHLNEDYSFGSLSIGSPDGLREVENFTWDELAQEFGYVGYCDTASRLQQMPPPKLPGNSFGGLPPLTELSLGGVTIPPPPAKPPKLTPGMGEHGDDSNVFEAVERHRGQEGPGSWNVRPELDRVISEITEGFHKEGFHVDIDVGVFADDPESDSEEWRRGQYKHRTPDGELTFPELSHGTRSVLGWVAQLMMGLSDHGDPLGTGNWTEKPGVFIIDEIDAHLHPSWQRRIIPTLQRHFPNVQIFASTHSPMMVAGLKKGQVHLLKRDATGQVVWSRNDRDIIGWTADEIYRTFMGIDDPTDERTARHAEELRDLRNKDHLTAEDEARMQELRRLVNEDLLAGGWLKAQDERFDEMMRRFMANRASDLSQDGA